MPRTNILKYGYLSVTLLVLLLAGLAAQVLAQNTGGVKGKIRNMAGERIASATVTARQDSKDIRSIRSNSKGEFQLDGLHTGKYNIVFDAKGYSSGIKYSVDVKANKTVDLGDRLILQVDQGTQVIVRGSVFFKDGTSVTAAKVLVELIEADGSVRKVDTVMTNIYGEFVFKRPEGAAKYRMTASYRDVKASKEIEVDSAAIYRLAISLDTSRQQK
ncbi:hypothetical protein BH20ACI2_BH20ACI2_05050 [soil metagenome]